MGQLLVRGVEDRIIRLLKERAARHGRSMEAEHRAILEDVFADTAETFAEMAKRLRESLPPSRCDSARQIRFDRANDYDYDPAEVSWGEVDKA